MISDKEEKCRRITDVPGDGKVSAKEDEKAEKYQDLEECWQYEER